MIRIVACLLLLSSACLAQEAPPLNMQQRLEAIIGSLVLQNAELSTRADALSRQVANLTKQLADAKAEKPAEPSKP